MGLFKIISFPIKKTNLIIYFYGVIIRILNDLILNVIKLFVNNCGIEKLKIKYNNKKIFPEIR